MLLKTLELQGFKSFPDKTKLEFHDGVTAVVGPNGSGKSNISDAIRWVLGETSSKSLRGSKMEDVIFVGTQERKSQGFAQVSLTFDNTSRLLDWDSDEVVISRKYYRSTDSEYFINGRPVMLKNITGLLMDTGLGKDGYSIIGQGRIDEIVSVKSSERRDIFEEAAGISKFRHRKAESERKLKQAEENLVRLRDILGELESRVGPLKEQSEKAKQFLELSEKKKILEITLWCNTLDSSKQKLREQDDKLILARQAYSQAAEAIEEINSEIERTYEQIQQSQINVEKLRGKKERNEQENSERTAHKAVLNNDIEHFNNDIERIKQEIEAYTITSGQLEQETQSRRSEITAFEQSLLQLEQDIVKAEADLMELSQKQDTVGSTFDDLNKSLNLLILNRSKSKLNLTSFRDNLENNRNQLEQVKNSVNQINTQSESVQNEYSQVKELLEQIKDKRQELVNSKDGYTIKLDSRRSKLQELTTYLNKLDANISERQQRVKILSDLEDSLEGFAYSVKKVIGEGKRGNMQGIHGTVAQLIELPPEYAVAVETALGGSLQNIIVENENAAKRSIRFLQENKAGRATFLPITSVKGNRLENPGLEKMDGFIGLACDLVSFDGKYDGIMAQILGRTAVVEDIDYAVSIAKRFNYKFKIVTLDGQVVNAGGSMTGGSQNKTSGLLNRKNEIKQLKNEIAKLTEKRESYTGNQESLEQQTAKLTAQLQAINSELTVLNEDSIRFEGERKRLEQQLEHNKQRLAEQEAQQNSVSKKISEFEQIIAKTSSELEVLQQKIDEEEQNISNLESSTSDLNNRRKILDEMLYQKRIEKAELLKEIENKRNVLAELEQRSEDNTGQIEQLNDSVNKKSLEIEKIKQNIADLEQQQDNFNGVQQSLTEKIQKELSGNNLLEQKTNQLRKQEQKYNSEKEQAGQELARLEERKTALERDYENIISRMWEEYQIAPGEAQAVAENFTSLTQLQKDLNGVKSKIKGLGNVNVGAIEEYKEVSQRYEFMKAQIKDVEYSKTELEKLITDLTTNMTSMFLDTYEKINGQFKKIFIELFGGGDANLSLDDMDNVLECGIEIQVQPPGKIIKNLTALSGGEKAFIAIAIYFAILKVSPSPFCVLDEIEAALDDVNVNKFASYLKTLDEQTQFIVITHRRGTMEQADMLYGVTMQEHGVSKLLELNVSEREQIKEIS